MSSEHNSTLTLALQPLFRDTTIDYHDVLHLPSLYNRRLIPCMCPTQRRPTNDHHQQPPRGFNHVKERKRSRHKPSRNPSIPRGVIDCQPHRRGRKSPASAVRRPHHEPQIVLLSTSRDRRRAIRTLARITNRRENMVYSTNTARRSLLREVNSKVSPGPASSWHAVILKRETDYTQQRTRLYIHTSPCWE